MKVFTIGDHLLPYPVATRLREHGMPAHVVQGTVFVVAPVKATALALFDDLFGGNWRGRDLRLAMGNDLDALDEAGVLTEGRVVAYYRAIRDEPILAFSTTDRQGTLIGSWHYTGNGKTVFTPVP